MQYFNSEAEMIGVLLNADGRDLLGQRRQQRVPLLAIENVDAKDCLGGLQLVYSGLGFVKQGSFGLERCRSRSSCDQLFPTKWVNKNVLSAPKLWL
ncbi:hypothetical protein T11_11040 [Trichinella zimbabwensis]|uniref:Uncharacterized protein n=1 Tax=Trichinella zimbabwensis TaxID=268475 RepID=A0A0V1I111_9BILA|nr:hypothetical protein T11_11040 [Trichinella zimbabwensis]